MSYQQESQRFVKYDNVDAEDLFYMPDEIDDEKQEYPYGDIYAGTAKDMVYNSYFDALALYKQMRGKGVAPQIARYVLPNATRTNLIVKGNLRSWRHICKLRMDRSAQPEMQVVVGQIYEQLLDLFPNAMYGVLDGERGAR
jgi:thymidylate synthase (FAD)